MRFVPAPGTAGHRQTADDPYALSPDRAAEPYLDDERDLNRVRYDGELRTWIGPFAMAGINTRVVRRGNALQDWSYGTESYSSRVAPESSAISNGH